jgi:hypothetical protein
MPPDSLKGQSDKDINVWKTEYDVVSTLRAAGHEVMPLGVQYELKPIRDAIEEFKADVAFNLLEQFHGETAYDTNVASYLELLKIPYTGCNPRGLMLARGKALSKKLVAYHRIPVPAFAVFPMRRKVKRPARLGFPLIVKSVSEDASIGIAQASVVENDEKLRSASSSSTRRSAPTRWSSSISRGASSMSACSATTGCACCRLGVRVRRHGRGRPQHRHRQGQARHRVPGKARHQERSGQGPVAGIAHPHRQHRQARLPHARDGRLQPRRLSACRPTASPISWKPTRIPKSPRSRTSPKPPPRTASSTATF